MKKLFGGLVAIGLATGISVFAGEAVEVEHLIKCEDGSTVEDAIADLNSSFVRGAVHAQAGRNTPTGYEPFTIMIRKPFKVSAPTFLLRDGRAPRVCVTISKE